MFVHILLSRLFPINISVSGVQAATYSYIGEFHCNRTRTKALSFVAMFMPACFVYLPLLAWAIIPMQWEFYLFDHMKISPWRIYLLFSSLLNGLNFIFLYRMPESPKFLLSMNRKAETINVLRNMYSVNMNCDKQVISSECPETNVRNWKPQIHFFSHTDVPSEWLGYWTYRNCSIKSAWNLRHIKIGVESNVPIISTAQRCEHISAVLFDVCFVFNRSRNIHVVSQFSSSSASVVVSKRRSQLVLFCFVFLSI